ncbi:hypothetical protein [Nonomuraea salmonea]|uniref:hypothetical protein n=1 Tax=Nonomuraea salmonea TaxID=46181 RepID=UPI002FE86AC5
MEIDGGPDAQQVTVLHVYQLLVEMRAQLASVLAIGDRHTEQIADHEARLRRAESDVAALTAGTKVLDDHELRLRSSEQWRYAVPAGGRWSR